MGNKQDIFNQMAQIVKPVNISQMRLLNNKIVEIRMGSHSHLKWDVVCNGKIVASHAERETAEIHKEEILTPLPQPQYKGKKLI